jgi:hypothetical protein
MPIRFVFNPLTGTFNAYVPGTGDKTFNYTQVLPAAVWTINHNLNKYPSVSAEDSSGNTIFGTIDYVNQNTIVITFGSSIAGVAYLN